jgi:DNA helicase HerA-like ATPase
MVMQSKKQMRKRKSKNIYFISRSHEGRKKQDPIAMQQYKTSACKTCAVYERCTKAPKNRGRVIERTAYAHLLEENKQRAKEQYAIYQQRQAIVEHPFGIIKRQWDFSYILTKRGKERASADVGLIFSAYNLRRIFTILDKNLLKKFLRELDFYFSILRSYLRRFTATFSTKTDIFLLKIYLHSAP